MKIEIKYRKSLGQHQFELDLNEILHLNVHKNLCMEQMEPVEKSLVIEGSPEELRALANILERRADILRERQ